MDREKEKHLLQQKLARYRRIASRSPDDETAMVLKGLMAELEAKIRALEQ